MHTFEFIRPVRSGSGDRDRRAIENGPAGRGRAIHGWRNNALRSDEAERRDSNRVLDINRLPLDKIETTSDGGMKIGAMVRNSDLAYHANGATGLFGAVASDPARRLGPDPQYGHRCRQPVAANTLRLLPRYCDGVQQARTRQRMPSHHRPQSHACHPGHERALHRDQSIRHVRGIGGAGSNDPHSRTEGYTRGRVRRFSSFARQHTASRDRTGARRPDYTCHAAAAHRAEASSIYLKLRDRASYEFALASAAVVLTIASGKITRARIALGGVGTKPWRSPEAEAALTGKPANDATFRQAAEAALQRRKATKRKQIQD